MKHPCQGVFAIICSSYSLTDVTEPDWMTDHKGQNFRFSKSNLNFWTEVFGGCDMTCQLPETNKELNQVFETLEL